MKEQATAKNVECSAFLGNIDERLAEWEWPEDKSPDPA